MSLLGCYANKVKLWHFRPLLLLLALTAPSLIVYVEAKENFYNGKLIDIGTHRLHIHCTGEGSPTVIFDSGIGGFSLEWAKIQKNLTKNNLKVCSYDRAGYGWSDSGPKPRTTVRITKELKTLLTQANIPGPYFLVGHSFGGYNVRYFASEYPKLTAGLILIDSSHPLQFNTVEFKKIKPKIIKPTKRINSFRINIIKPVIADNYPEQNKRVAYILMSTNKSKRTLMDELESMEISAIQLSERSNHKTYNLPVTLITRGKRAWPNDKFGNRREQQWTKLQYDLENISDNTTHYFAHKSGHAIHLDEPKLVTDKILSAIIKSRNRVIKNELRKIFSNSLVTYSIISSFNIPELVEHSFITDLNRKIVIKKHISQTEWLNNSLLTRQFDIKKINRLNKTSDFYQ